MTHANVKDHPTARSSKLTDELRDRIALLIRAGNTVEMAAQATGIAESTF